MPETGFVGEEERTAFPVGFFNVGIRAAPPPLLRRGLSSSQHAARTLNRKAQLIQELPDVAGMKVDGELVLEHATDHGRGPDAGIEPIGHGPTVDDIGEVPALSCSARGGDSAGGESGLTGRRSAMP